MAIVDDVVDSPLLMEWGKDVRAAAAVLTSAEARWMVDQYYTIQEYRIAAGNQVRGSEEPNAVLRYIYTDVRRLEERIAASLAAYVRHQPLSAWFEAQYGIGPIIAAGLMAHIDIERAPTAGHIYSYAGLVPGVEWKKGQRRPWNAALKTLCWKIGQSFLKFHRRGECHYGRIYAERKAYETARNEAGENAETARETLASRRFRAETEARRWLEDGKLPPAQIDARARRYAVKMFLAAYHLAAYWSRYNTLPPKPYAVAVQGHAHIHVGPGVETLPGLVEALREAGWLSETSQ